MTVTHALPSKVWADLVTARVASHSERFDLCAFRWDAARTVYACWA